MDIRASGGLPDGDGREDLGEGIGCSRARVMRFRMKIWKDLYGGGLDKGRSMEEGKTHASEDGQEL